MAQGIEDLIAAGELELGAAIDVKLPSTLVPTSNLLEFNFELDDGKLPFEVLGRLRVIHGIDVTALSMSQTVIGRCFRAHALTNPAL